MELPYGLVESILVKLPVKSLLRFKSVSIQWKCTIESRYFKEKHLICRQSQDPDILMIDPLEFDKDFDLKDENVTRMFVMGSSDLIKLPNICPLREPIRLENHGDNLLHYTYLICGSCDGMICYYNEYNCIYVVNPITRWSRSVPQARFQAAVLDMMNRDSWRGEGHISLWNLGFGKDKFTGTYTLVWLYNSFELGLSNVTTCEVFDFFTNTWRYATGAPVRILDKQIPLYLDGLLYWFTDDNIVETRILSFDIHTENFQIISKAPFVEAASKQIIMCNLNNRLCVSQKKWPTQEIWSLNKTSWEKIYSLNLQTDPHWFAKDLNPHIFFPTIIISCAIPVAVLKKKKQSLVLYDARANNPNLVIYDPDLRSYDSCFVRDYRPHHTGTAISFFPSLMSIL
ncbi:hypothetical protein EUTSA_v10017844mg [Eutrema salsugineum]|uniref:F-box domain-containing protein n=1 Tax=Eutrema salsugineum TaxID=72664 RepID=V4NYQ6_EUTSA|nr:hypothetical protein EUTSA_v10017844mg [Eutrema salsugineum]